MVNILKNKLNLVLNKTIKQDNVIIDNIIGDVFNGGKRLRPMLSYIIFKSFISNIKNVEFDDEEILKICLSTEILHNISLILDDMPCMDNDNYRRDKETIHYRYGCHTAISVIFNILGLYGKEFKKYIKRDELILIDDTKIKLEEYILNTINVCCLELIDGQYLDLNYIPVIINEKMILKINSFKTVPLFRLSFLLGYFLIYKVDKGYNFSEKVISDLGEMAKNFGIIFQISDDYLDIDQDKKNKIFLNFFLTLGKKRTLEIYEENLKSLMFLLEKYNLDIKDIIELINNRIYG